MSYNHIAAKQDNEMLLKKRLRDGLSHDRLSIETGEVSGFKNRRSTVQEMPEKRAMIELEARELTARDVTSQERLDVPTKRDYSKNSAGSQSSVLFKKEKDERLSLAKPVNLNHQIVN